MASEAILGAQFAVHAVPCQSSRAFLRSIKDILPANVPIISVSKGLEVSSSELSHKISGTNHSININLSYKYQYIHNPTHPDPHGKSSANNNLLKPFRRALA